MTFVAIVLSFELFEESSIPPETVTNIHNDTIEVSYIVLRIVFEGVSSSRAGIHNVLIPEHKGVFVLGKYTTHST